jgi:hypothetical protein
MDTRKLVLPAAVFVGGALLGRLVGIKGLVRAGMAALTVASASESAGLLTAGKREVARRPVHKPARKRAAVKRSGRKAAKKSASASTQTH